MANPSPIDDPYGLSRFLRAQKDSYSEALAEIKRGRKESHWMWFIFPQFHGLGRSPTSTFYSIKSKEEARAYLEHPVLGKRLLECCDALLRSESKSASEIFGSPDDLKLHSSLSLFASVSAPGSVFSQVLEQYYDGKPDHQTLELLQRSPAEGL